MFVRPSPTEAQRFSGRGRGLYDLLSPNKSQITYRTFPLSAYVGVVAAQLVGAGPPDPDTLLPTLVAAVEALFEPATTYPADTFLAHLHAYVHQCTSHAGVEAALHAEAVVPPVHPLVPCDAKEGRWVCLRASLRDEAEGALRRFAVPSLEATGLRATLQQLCTPHASLSTRVQWRVGNAGRPAPAILLETDEAAWQAIDALQLMHAHRVARAPRFPRMLKHWFAATGDAEMDRLRRSAVRRTLLTWVDASAGQYEFTEHPSNPKTPAKALEPHVAAVQDQLFGFLADAWESVGELSADLYATSPEEPGVLAVLRMLLLLAAPRAVLEISRAGLGWLVDSALPGPEKRPPHEVAAVHGPGYAYVRKMWLDEYGRVPVRDWIPCVDRAPLCALLSFARSPLLTPAERRRVLYSVRVPTPTIPRVRELYGPRSEWRAWSHSQDTVLVDPRTPAPPAPGVPPDSETEAQLLMAARLLPMLEYSMYYPCTAADPQRLEAAVAAHGFALPATLYLSTQRHWAVSTVPVTDTVQYDHQTLLQMYERPANTPLCTEMVHAVTQHWGADAYRRFRVRLLKARRPALSAAAAGKPVPKKQRHPGISLPPAQPS